MTWWQVVLISSGTCMFILGLVGLGVWLRALYNDICGRS